MASIPRRCWRWQFFPEWWRELMTSAKTGRAHDQPMGRAGSAISAGGRPGGDALLACLLGTPAPRFQQDVAVRLGARLAHLDERGRATIPASPAALIRPPAYNHGQIDPRQHSWRVVYGATGNVAIGGPFSLAALSAGRGWFGIWVMIYRLFLSGPFGFLKAAGIAQPGW